jgi:hypothetical protein
VTVSNRALLALTDALRRNRNQLGTRWRRLSVGQQALLVVAHLRKGETYADPATLAVLAPTPADAIEVAAGKAFVILDGTVLRMDRVGMAAGATGPTTAASTSVTG